MSRGAAWTYALATGTPWAPVPSVVRAEVELRGRPAAMLSVIADPRSPYARARHGELGVREALVLAEQVDDIVRREASADRSEKRAIVAIVDLPSQAYGRLEEVLGIHELIACAVNAYATARTAGHPVIALVVGSALSGGFLAHGLQANQIIALRDPGVEIHAMHRPAAARITRRTVGDLEQLAATVAPMSYSVEDWATLGSCDELLDVAGADRPSRADVRRVREALGAAVQRARDGPLDLSNRRTSESALRVRTATSRVYELIARQW